MGYIFTKNLTPGMVTAADVFNYNDQLIIPANTVLDDNLISRMEYYSIQRINVKDPVEKSEDSAEKTETQADSYSSKVINSTHFKEFKKNFMENIDTLQNSMQEILDRDVPIDNDVLLGQTTTLIDPKATTIEVFDMIHNMRQYDDSTYAHCINVSLICRIIAKWLQFNEEDTNVLTIAGLLHDIGKLSIPDSIIKKPDKLTSEEFDIIKTHTTNGFEVLRRQKNIDKRILNAALMHHERCDGSGYPNGLHANQIDDFAKIVAIADVYDAMTAARVYRGPQCPFKVITIFEEEGLQKYDPQFILTFLERIVSSYMNNNVRLSDGRIGEIIMINPGKLSRPMVRVENDYIDLSKESSLHIEDLV